jgi:SAM-dependent methyltransferase
MKTAWKTIEKDIGSVAFWAETWEKVSTRSFLRRYQERYPERWAAFYDRVAELWPTMGGGKEGPERKIVHTLLQEQVVFPGATALDLGCGPGKYALLLAEAGVRVTALDLSPTMVDVLRRRAAAGGIGSPALNIVQKDWEEFRPRKRFHLVLAAGFPQALSPSGIGRMESLSRRRCALILGTGEDPFPFRRLLWERIMGPNFPQGKAGLYCLIFYLWSSGRTPHISPFQQEVILSLPVDGAVFFYREYFGIFGKTGKKTEDLIREVLSPFAKRGRIRCRGKRETVLIWWEIPESFLKRGRKRCPTS